MSAAASNVVLSIASGEATPLALTRDNGGFRFAAPNVQAGAYKVSAIFDASGFDWDRLWFPMNQFGNAGQRTGPWDFEFEHFEPIVPAWWVYLNGRRLGLTAVRRPGPADILERRMWLNFCFEVSEAGEVIVAMTQFNSADLVPLQFRLEPLLDEVPCPVPLVRPAEEGNWAGHQVVTRVWQQWTRTVDASPRLRDLLRRAVDQLRTQLQEPATIAQLRQEGPGPARLQPMDADLLPLLGYLYRAGAPLDALGIARLIIEQRLAQAHWGNACESGYGCDGDMGAAATLESLSAAYHWFGDALDLPGRPLRAAMLKRLAFQMNRFRELMLLWWDYWGGSVLQDHGYRSIGRYGIAAINLLGLLPGAAHHVAAAAARVRRTLAALPRDGAIPFSSYQKLNLYTDDLVRWRDAWKHLSGEDIFDHAPFGDIVSFVANRLHEPTLTVLTISPRGDRKDLYTGWAFLAAMVSRYRDGQAAQLIDRMLDRYSSAATVPARALMSLPSVLANLDGSVQAAPLKPQEWDCRRESGQISYRPSGQDVCVSVRCAGSAGSSYGYDLTQCPCDHMIDTFLEGHFTVHRAGQTLLATAEGGYRMRSALGCTLIIDGQGGFGDMDFAMATPALGRRNYRIETATYDPETGQGFVRMNLAPGYAREARIVRYVRELQLNRHGLVCRDVIVSTLDHSYAWHFHTFARHTIEPIADNGWSIAAGGLAVTLQGRCVETLLRSSTHDTEVVWAYSNENDGQPFVHVRYETSAPCRVMTAEFKIEWPGS